ncbi:MAG: NAD-dependent epimerase/dehydratase family protein [Chloroflexota bacterium]
MEYKGLYRGKKVLVTGGLGFIGSSLAHELVGLGADVTLVDCLLPGQGGNAYNIRGLEERVRVSDGDIRDRQTMERLVVGQDCIFNLAGQAFHLDSMLYPFKDLDINCNGQLTLLEACRLNNPGVKIVFAGTRQVYGRPDYLPLDEAHPLRPVDINGIHKAAAERYHLLYHAVYGLRASSIRLTNTYGPRQLVKHDRGGFIGWFVRQAIDGQEIQVFGDGSQLRDFTFASDAVDAFLRCGASDRADGEVYNLGGEKPYTMLEFVGLLTGLCPGSSYRLVPFPEERKRIDTGSVYSSYDKIRDSLGWQPQTGLEKGLAEAVDYFKRHKAHYW